MWLKTTRGGELGAVYMRPKFGRINHQFGAPWNSNQYIAILMLLLSDMTSSYIFDRKVTENEKQRVILPLQDHSIALVQNDNISV